MALGLTANRFLPRRRLPNNPRASTGLLPFRVCSTVNLRSVRGGFGFAIGQSRGGPDAARTNRSTKEDPVSLFEIVKTLGGDIYDRGRRANVPAPGHSARDRSVSLYLNRSGRVVVHTFGDSDWREILDDLRARNLVDGDNRPTGHFGPRPVRPEIGDRERTAAAHRVWDLGRAAAGTLSERHARLRAIGRPLPDLSTMRHGGQTPIAPYRPQSAAAPALLVAIRDHGGDVTAVEITYLGADARRTRALRLSRKMIGTIPPSSAVRIDPAESEMLVGEGFFTSLSASEWFGLPAWALLSTSNLRSFSPPPQVRKLLIAADRGADGERSAALLAERVGRAGIAVRVEFPPSPFRDFNDAMLAHERRLG